IIHSDVNGVLTSSKVNLTNGVDVTGLLPVINGGSPFTEGNGSIFQRNTTEDLLLGSNATSSAKFSFLNVAGGTPTASISGGVTGALSLTGTGTISTTAFQPL